MWPEAEEEPSCPSLHSPVWRSNRARSREGLSLRAVPATSRESPVILSGQPVGGGPQASQDGGRGFLLCGHPHSAQRPRIPALRPRELFLARRPAPEKGPSGVTAVPSMPSGL